MKIVRKKLDRNTEYKVQIIIFVDVYLGYVG